MRKAAPKSTYLDSLKPQATVEPKETNYEDAKNFTVLCVIGNQNQVFKISKIQNKIKGIDKDYKIIKTTYDEFKEGKKQDKYHCVMIALMENNLTASDLIKQQDHYDYYATVPIVHWGVSQAIADNYRSMRGITSFMKTNM